MTTFTLTITNASHLAGITVARAAYNAALPATDEQPVEQHPDYLATDEAYVQYVMSRAAESYARQYGT